MYRTLIWPLIILAIIPVLAWAMFERTGWGYVAALTVVGLMLASLAFTQDRLDQATLRTAVVVTIVLSIAGTLYTGVAFGDPLLAVPFLASLGGAVAISRAAAKDAAERSRR